MYARIVTAPIRPEAITEATNYFRDSVGPALKKQAGFVNSRFLIDSKNNRCLMVTLWASDEARTESETNGFLKGVLDTMKPHFSGSPTVGQYEVAVQVA